MIYSRNCYKLLQRGFVIPHKKNAATHEQMRTVENIVENDKGGMIISPQIGLHENVVVLEYESEYANLIPLKISCKADTTGAEPHLQVEIKQYLHVNRRG